MPSSSTKRTRVLGIPRASACRPEQMGQHLLSPEGLAQDGTADELDLADHVALVPELEVGFDPLLVSDEPQLLQTPDLGPRTART